MKSFRRKTLSMIVVLVLVLSTFLTTQVTTSVAAGVDLNNADYKAFNQILFVKHQPYPSGYGENHMCDGYFGFNGVPGGGVYILNNAFSGSPTVTDVLANSTCTNGRYQGQHLTGGAFFKADLNYDGNQIVFSYTDAARNWDVWNVNTTYHVFKVNVDGTGLTQLTDGVFNDMCPAWLPDGRIIFVSERRGGFGRCHQRTVPTYTLYTMNSDGSDIRCISYHETNEWNPAVDNNGMIVYTRWDYVDRGATHAHSSWITQPDGMDSRELILNYPNSSTTGGSWWLNVPLKTDNVRPIPNSTKLIANAAPHHGQPYGPIIMLDPDTEDDDNLSCITKITTEAGYPESAVGTTSDQLYATPYALSENNFLCVYDPNANTDGDSKRYGIYALDKNNNKTLLYSDANISCLAPIPLRARTKPVIIAGSKQPSGAPSDGIVTCNNVYNSLLPMPAGYTSSGITSLRIWQVYPKSTVHATDPCVSYESTESAYAGRNTKGLIGSVPVNSDGSVSFYLNANKTYLFQTVDANDMAVQTMRSDTFVIGGQGRLSCQGCHEPKYTAPSAGTGALGEATAWHNTPSTITAETASGAIPMSFPRLIQPILNNKCISCHTGSPNVDLRQGTADANGWSVAYNSLRSYVFLFDVYYSGSDWNKVYPRTEPGKFGSRMSSLWTTYLQDANHNTLLTTAEKHAFKIWMDSGTCPFYGEYNDLVDQQAGAQVNPLYN